MKYHHPFYPALFLLIFTQCVSCKVKDPFPTPAPSINPIDQLPPATQTGQRTFGCLVNGQAWTPAGNPFGAPLFTADYHNRNLYLTADRAVITNGITSKQRIQFEIDSLDRPGAFILKNATSRTAELSDSEKSCLFTTAATQPATVIITRLDPVNRVVSGTFSFTLATPSCGQVIVTDGRFDSLF